MYNFSVNGEICNATKDTKIIGIFAAKLNNRLPEDFIKNNLASVKPNVVIDLSNEGINKQEIIVGTIGRG
ncbi:MAG: hypothetical protein MJ231_05985 [bacterium]|nr:hypothetical protein [bacterium]